MNLKNNLTYYFKRLCLFIFVTFAAFGANADQNPEWNANDAYRFFDFERVIPSPDGKKVAILLRNMKKEWQSQIYLLEMMSKEGKFLAIDCKNISWIEWVSNTQLGYLAKNEGVFNLYSLSIGPNTSSQPIQHTDLDRDALYFLPSPSGKKIALAISGTSNSSMVSKGIEAVGEEALSIHQLYLLDGKGERVTTNKLQLISLPNRSLSTKKPNIVWSPDERSLIYVDQISARATDEPSSKLVQIDLQSGNAVYLPTGSGYDVYPSFSPSGNRLAFVQANPMSKELRNPSYRVYLYDFASKQVVALAKTFDEGPEIIGWSADGKEVIVFEFFKSAFRLYGVPTDGSKPRSLSPEGEPILFPVLNQGNLVFFISHNFDRPDEAYSLNLSTGKQDRLTSIQSTDSLPKIEVQNLSWLSTDGLIIEGTLLLPLTKGKEPLPLVVLAHGGPGNSSNNAFAGIPYKFSFPSMPVLFTSRGMAVLWVYFRGSDGYGLSFRWANYRNFCKGPYEDIISGVKLLIDKGIADQKKISLLGWSYGGYLGCYAATQENPFSSIAVWAPFTDLIPLFATQDIPFYLPSYFGGFPTQVPQLYTQQSPIHLMNEQMHTPIMLLHGKKDGRVPPTQSQEFHTLMRFLDLPSKFYLFDEETHTLMLPQNQIFAEEEVLKWFQSWNEKLPPTHSVLVTDSSGIHRSTAKKIILIKNEQQIREVLDEAKRKGLKITILGKRHSQASQIIFEGALALDMTAFDEILEIDRDQKLVRLQGGCTWEKLQLALQPLGLAPSIMQSLNNFTIAGSISSNIIGRDPRKSSIQESIHSLKLMLADGTVRICSREENRELFSAVIGGYGLFGVILEATLQLETDECLILQSSEIETDLYENYVEKIKLGGADVLYHTALFTLSKEHPFQKAFLITYFSPKTNPQPELGLNESNLMKTAYKLPPALSTYGFVTRIKASSLYFLPEGSLNFVGCGIPLRNFSAFMKKAEALVLETGVPISESSTKIIKKDDLTMLPLILENDTVVVVMAYQQTYSQEALDASQKFKKGIGKLSSDFEGRVYLTFDYDVSQEELDKTYPRWKEFLDLKKHYDPGEIFYSNFYQHLISLDNK